MKAIRALWLLLGFACFGLGALGAVLPVLPTVPIPFCLVDWLWVRGAILLAVCIKYWYLLCRVKTAGRAEEEAE